MKNNQKIRMICFLGMLGILLSNCKKSESTVDRGLTANDKNLATAGDDKWDLLGYGYDMTGELFSLKNASQGAIIDVDRFNLEYPGRINTPTTGSGSDFVYSGATAYDYVKDVNRQHNFGITGSAGNSTPADPNKLYATANISSNNGDQNTFTYNSKYSYATYESVKNVKSLIFHDASVDLLKNYLTPLFVYNLSNLTSENLVKTYGTHVLLGITIGGRLRYHYNGSVVKETTAERRLRAIKAGFSFGVLKIFGINLTTDISNEEKTTIVNETTEKSYLGQYFGGTNGGASFTTDAQGNASQSINLAGWQQSVTANNAALTDITSAVPIYEFITDPIKKQQVKSAVDKYIADRQVVIIQEPIEATTPIWYPDGAKSILVRGQGIYTQNKKYFLSLQADGRLVLYNVQTGELLWANNKFGGDKLIFAPDGNLVVQNNAGQVIWAANFYWKNTDNTNNKAMFYTLQEDGNLVFYNNGQVICSTHTSTSRSNHFGVLKP